MTNHHVSVIYVAVLTEANIQTIRTFTKDKTVLMWK